MNVRSFLPIIAISLFVIRAAAQAPSVDTLAHTETAKVIDAYNKTVGDQSAFYNGQEYYPPAQAVKGSPFFLGAMSMQPSLICYDHTWYKDVPVFYDLLNDQMVSAARNVLYSVRAERLSDVVLAGHHFIYLSALESENLDPGYYDQLYAGKSEVLVKRTCSVVTRAGDRTTEVFYEDRNVIYIKKGNQYVSVSSKGSALHVFKDRAKQLKQQLSANKISYGKDREGSIVKLATWYDQPAN